MKVVFLETVEGSGAMGEVRDVAHGYARNYLLPRGLAAAATPNLLRRVDALAAIEEVQQRAQDEHAHELVGRLEGKTLVMAVRVGEQGRLYGSVTSADIAENAGEILGEELDRRRVLLPEVIRSVGLSTVPIRLSRNVTTEVQVAVVDAEAPEGVEAAVQQLLVSPVEVPPTQEIPATEDVTTADTGTVSGASETNTDNVSEPGDHISEEAVDEPTSGAGDGVTEEAETGS